MRIRTIMLAAVLALGACGGKSKGPEAAGDTTATAKPLYDRLGGKEGITAVVKDLIANVGADARINTMFANSDLAALETKLIDQICEASGGPCKYTGKTMKETHAGMGVTEAHFNALVEDLVKSLDKIGVKDPEKSELLGALGGMKGDIVEK
ncbi:MAG TPA: group 1 truncated hemoglobin [Kofleriaceae bacterium]|nr:group 1 truncated hemoglobin [Kofleriaceae bacterium]